MDEEAPAYVEGFIKAVLLGTSAPRRGRDPVSSIGSRLRRLEGRVPRPDPGAEEREEGSRLLFAVLDELSGMGAMMSDSSYRGSPNGLVKIEPRDIAWEFYGREYTEREFLELAIVRALEKRGCPEETIEDYKPGLLEFFAEEGGETW